MRMNLGVRLGTGMAVALVSWMHPSAQQANAAQDATPKIEVNVNRVLVPVVVRDKQGRSVGDLKKEDFQVLDEDKPQVVSGFTVETRDLTRDQTRSDTSGGQPAQAASSDALPQRIVVFLFDDMHLSAEDLAYARKAGVKAIHDSLDDSDVAAVVSTSGKTNSGLTRDRVKLQDAILGVQPHGFNRADGADCPRIEYYQADLMENEHDSTAVGDAIRQVFSCNPGMDPTHDVDMAERLADSAARRVLQMGDQDVLATFATTREIIRRMAPLPGQHLLVLVSPGFLALAPDALTAESQLIDFAAQSNVTVSALDARGLYTTELEAKENSPNLMQMNHSGGSVQTQSDYRRSSMLAAEGVMASLADGTGGAFFHNNNDLEAGFKLLTETPATLYLLELSPNEAKPGHHRLKVKVNRDGLQVQARRGYFVAKPEKHKK
jgi:VWFA-related protein